MNTIEFKGVKYDVTGICICGHYRSLHYNGRGMCDGNGMGYSLSCSCRKFKKIKTGDFGIERLVKLGCIVPVNSPKKETKNETN